MSGVGFTFTIDFPVVGDWENVDQVRLSLQSCISHLFQNVDHRDLLAMVAGELLENAVKYAHRTDEVTMFRLKIWGALGDVAFVQVSNPVDADGATTALASIEGIKSVSSVEEAYRTRMLAIASQPSRLSRLGLLRIAYEGGCELSGAVLDDVLTITAAVPHAS